MLWVETPTNPLLRVVDLEAVAALARRRNLISVADNTFASPYIQRPLELGFDIVVHSTTKYLNGHSDMVGGTAVVGPNRDLEDRLRFLQNAIGGISGPFDSFLALRGLKTLALRMERHSRTGRQSPNGWNGERTCAASSTPASPAIRSTPSPDARCKLRRHGHRRA